MPSLDRKSFFENLPNNIVVLRIVNYDCDIELNNLPSSLTKIIITCVKPCNIDVVDFKENIKLPFGCEILFEN